MGDQFSVVDLTSVNIFSPETLLIAALEASSLIQTELLQNQHKHPIDNVIMYFETVFESSDPDKF